ncbi:uncharacterized protein LOC127104494 [Lathyrus oleraceus]|uniref:uncharacterized protein LOC127104494 n=1 Tax=Pisum sativum TaxID=3888 RepID=UPI0021CE590C|nr:uncharacterized protein LOC127104494 [Pisum sativum]
MEYHDGFRKRYGNILSLMKVKVDSMALRVLSHFYDPTYHRFTFPDYQLSLTLEEFTYIMGIPIRDKIPFIGGKEVPKSHIIGAYLHVPKVEVENGLIMKGGISGFPIKYLVERASHYANIGSHDVFEAILDLMIYGILLFPSFKDFVDMDAIRVFMTCNLVPTLLGDVYYSIHFRTEKKGGWVNCYAPILYKWFISHLQQSTLYNKDNFIWSKRLMALTNKDIVWYNATYDIGTTVLSCGEFPNVPLINTKGVIIYNPSLEYRQLGYSLDDNPESLLVTLVVIQEGEENVNLRRDVMKAWSHISQKKNSELSPRNSVAKEAYTTWVKSRASKLKMPYPPPPPLSSEHVEPAHVSFEEFKKLKEESTQLMKDTYIWENKLYFANEECSKLRSQLQEKEDMTVRQKVALEQGVAKRQRLDRDLKASWFAFDQHKEKLLHTEGLL